MKPPRYFCRICGWIYDPSTDVQETGIEAGIPFKNLPDDFRCPVCGVGKEDFLLES